MHLTSRFRLLLLSAVFALAGCHSGDATVGAGSDSPEAAMRQSIALIRAGDFGGFWRHALPAQDYATLRADWGRAGTQVPLTESERSRIDATLRQLDAPDAEAALDAQLQPWLAQARARYADQLPLLVGVGRALATSAIAQNPRLDEAQKQHATALVGALVPWAQKAPWFDPAKARQTVGVVVATARKLDIHDAASLRSMGFDQAMGSYATAFAGIKQLLALYGLPIEQALASARVVPLDYHPPYARVRVEFELLGTPLSMESTLVQQGGHWYDQDLVESVREAHRRLSAPANAASAPAGTRVTSR